MTQNNTPMCHLEQHMSRILVAICYIDSLHHPNIKNFIQHTNIYTMFETVAALRLNVRARSVSHKFSRNFIKVNNS